jgi:cysteine desulfurase
MKKNIYLDYASTTPVAPTVFLAMKKFWSKDFGNPSSITKLGLSAKKAVDQARTSIANKIASQPREVIFTGGGTESNNLAIFGTINYLAKQDYKISDLHFITTTIEHSSILECFKEIERRGGQVTYLSVNESGIVDPKTLRNSLRQNTALVSIGYANNEIGVVQPLRYFAKEIRFAKKKNLIMSGNLFPYFHTDASQAGHYLDLNTSRLGIDLLTLDGQKIFGPKGIAILFKKMNIEIAPIIFGGGQEKGLRSGTENVPLIVGMAEALEIVRDQWEKKTQKATSLRDYFWKKIKTSIPQAVINGDPDNRLANNLNVSIPGIDPEFTVIALDELGITASTKSACDHESEESFVIRALGTKEEYVRSAIRFTLGEGITLKDLNFVVKTLKKIVRKQHNFSTLAKF